MGIGARARDVAIVVPGVSGGTPPGPLWGL